MPSLPPRPTLADFAGADPAAALEAVYDRIAQRGARPVWITLLDRARAHAMLAEASRRREAGADLPLYGVPFAIKDNIDLAGVPTTAACPGFAYTPQRSAGAVQRLVDAGAIPVGKTNLDQFATGLNGTRSPYGIPTCVYDPARISGGSSSGSAVAVAAGLVPFALGTDTAGSGRVPAAINNLVGLKPTKGLVSASGVVPACRSLDCVSVFTHGVADALAVLDVLEGFDPEDPYSRHPPAAGPSAPGPFRFGVPGRATLAACSGATLALFDAACLRMERCGGTRVPIDFAPFAEAAGLLYAGPWLAERLAALEPILHDHADQLDPAVRAVIEPGRGFSAADAFRGQYRLAALLREVEPVWRATDLLLLPTAPFVPTVAAMLAEPVALNAALGAYTNFVNLMDLCATAVPAGFDEDGIPFGVTLVGPAFADRRVAGIAGRLHGTLARRAEPAPALA